MMICQDKTVLKDQFIVVILSMLKLLNKKKIVCFSLFLGSLASGSHFNRYYVKYE